MRSKHSPRPDGALREFHGIYTAAPQLLASELFGHLRGAFTGAPHDDERERIIQALRRTEGRKGAAARLLGVDRSTLWRKLREPRITG